MPGFVDTVIESLKQTLEARLWLYFFLVQVLETIASLALIAVFVIVVLIALFGSLGTVSLEKLPQLFTSPSFITGAIGILLLIGAAFFIVMTYITSFFTGLRLNLFNNFREKKKLDFSAALQQTGPRVLTFFKISLLITAAILLIVALMLLPLLPLALGLGSSSNFAGILAVILFIALIALVVGIASFFLLPVFFLLAPVAFFGKQGAIETIKKSLGLAKADYWGNLAFVLVYLIITVVVNLVVNAIAQLLGFLAMLPAIAAAGASPAAAGAGFAGAFGLFYVIFFVIFIPYAIWQAIFSTACMRNLYLLDEGLLFGGKGKGKKK